METEHSLSQEASGVTAHLYEGHRGAYCGTGAVLATGCVPPDPRPCHGRRGQSISEKGSGVLRWEAACHKLLFIDDSTTASLCV